MRKFFEGWEAVSVRFKLTIIFPAVSLALLASTIVFGVMLLNSPPPQNNNPRDFIPATALVDINTGDGSESEDEDESTPRIFLALGDSVASGFGVTPEERYSAVLFDMLKAGGVADEYINMGIVGITTTELLALLRNADEDSLEQIKNASVIALNIGGNNILVPFIDFLPGPENIMDIITESWDFIFESLDTVLDFVDVALDSWEVVDGWRLWQVWRIPALNRVRRDISATLDDVLEVVDRALELELVNLLPLLQGDFSPELEAGLQRGVRVFESEFREVLSWLEVHAPEAVVVVNTVYNPLPHEFLGLSLEISKKADELVRDLNNIILSESVAKGHLVADVYAAFADESDNVMNMFLDTSTLLLSFDIIHPNSIGHRLIADLNYYKLREVLE
jgi:lysophospholipase L1-like esterase